MIHRNTGGGHSRKWRQRVPGGDRSVLHVFEGGLCGQPYGSTERTQCFILREMSWGYRVEC